MAEEDNYIKIDDFSQKVLNSSIGLFLDLLFCAIIHAFIDFLLLNSPYFPFVKKRTSIAINTSKKIFKLLFILNIRPCSNSFVD